MENEQRLKDAVKIGISVEAAYDNAGIIWQSEKE